MTPEALSEYSSVMTVQIQFILTLQLLIYQINYLCQLELYMQNLQMVGWKMGLSRYS